MHIFKFLKIFFDFFEFFLKIMQKTVDICFLKNYNMPRYHLASGKNFLQEVLYEKVT